MTNFISIDCHAHYEPKILNANGILKRMKEHGIENMFDVRRDQKTYL